MMKSASSRNLALSSLIGVEPQQQPLLHAIMPLWSPRCCRPPRRDLWHRALGGKRAWRKSCAKELETRLRFPSLYLVRIQAGLVNAPSPTPVHLHPLDSSICAAAMLRGARRVAEQPVDAARRAAGQFSLSRAVSSPARLLRTAARRDAPAPPSCLRFTFNTPSPGVRKI